jgi:ankyrin repeat protein
MAANAEEARNKQFYAAVRANDITTVSRLIGEGANIEYVDQSHLKRNADGNELPGQLYNTATALGVAAVRGNIDMARVLLDAGAQVVYPYQLARVVRLGNIEFVRLLLERNPDIVRGSYMVLDAIESGNNDIVRLLLENGANPNATSYNIPAIARAVHINNTECVRVLLEHNADTNYTNRGGLNLLYHAIGFRNFDIARLLFGANPALVKPSDRERMPGFLGMGARGHATVAWERARQERLGLAPKAGTGSNTASNKKGGRRSTRKSMKKHRRH